MEDRKASYEVNKFCEKRYSSATINVNGYMIP
jgi:hypothetical protein